jgi:uncharacterized membrane protein YoaK (UPF0700 family)
MPYPQAQLIDRKRAILNTRHLIPGAVAFAATAGYVNSIALGFFQSPVSHMTGTVSYLGIGLAAGRFRDSLISFGIFLGFLLGAVLGGLIVGARQLLPGRRHGIALLAESGLLAAATFLLLRHQRWGMPIASMACGLQNATTSSYCGLLIRTTHVTGTVTDIGVMIGHWIRHRQIERWKLGFMLTIVCAFGCGVCLGAIANAKWGPAGLELPAAGTAIAGLILCLAAGRGWLRQDMGEMEDQLRTASFPDTP